MSYSDRLQAIVFLVFILCLFVIPSSILLWRSALNKWEPKRRNKSRKDKDE